MRSTTIILLLIGVARGLRLRSTPLQLKDSVVFLEDRSSVSAAANQATSAVNSSSTSIENSVTSGNSSVASISSNATTNNSTFSEGAQVGQPGNGLAVDVGGHIVSAASTVASSVDAAVQGASKVMEDVIEQAPETIENVTKKVKESEAMKTAQRLDSWLRSNQGSTSSSFADLEACVGCNFVWATVKKELGGDANTKYEKLSVQSTFEEICQDMPDVFYESCDDMMDQAGYLSDLFSRGLEPTVMCDLSGICGANGAQALFAASMRTLSGDISKRLMTG